MLVGLVEAELERVPPRCDLDRRHQPVLFETDEVVHVVKPPVEHVEGVPAEDRPLREQDALGATIGDLDVGGDPVGSVAHVDGGFLGHRSRERVVDVPPSPVVAGAVLPEDAVERHVVER